MKFKLYYKNIIVQSILLNSILCLSGCVPIPDIGFIKLENNYSNEIYVYSESTSKGIIVESETTETLEITRNDMIYIYMPNIKELISYKDLSDGHLATNKNIFNLKTGFLLKFDNEKKLYNMTGLTINNQCITLIKPVVRYIYSDSVLSKNSSDGGVVNEGKMSVEKE